MRRCCRRMPPAPASQAACLPSLLLVSLLLVLQLPGQAQGAAAQTPQHETAAGGATSQSGRLTQAILSSLAHIRQDIFSWWQQHGPDTRYGGFHGTLARSGEAVAPTFKGLVQQTRHVWAFSTYSLRGYTSSAAESNAGNTSTSASTLQLRDAAALRTPQQHRHLLRQQRPEQQQQLLLLTSRQMAKTAFDFVVTHMHDQTTDLFHWTATQDGTQVLQDNKVIYGQFFVLYAFSQYHTAFGDARARDLALRCFRAMDAAWHSSAFGGFDELPENSLPPLPTTAAAATSGKARQPQQQQQPQVRTLNVAMHGLEALTALHKVTQDPVVLTRVREYLDIICSRLNRTRGLIYEEYIPTAAAADGADGGLWQPAPGSAINYGHNLESTWLVAETLDYLQSIAAISPQRARQYRAVVMSIGAAAVRDGFDAQHGGVFESGLPDTGPQSTLKVWWIQAESMLALWKLHQYYELGAGSAAASAAAAAGAASNSNTTTSSSSLTYIEMLANTARFVRDHITDTAGGGEQFWEVEADGLPSINPGDIKAQKGSVWKASYHDSRSVLFLEQMMRRQY